LHLTLIFIGYVSDEQMHEICQATRQAAADFEPLHINFNRILLGPPGKKPPRMIWLEGEASQGLAELKKKLEQALLNCDSGLRSTETRLFRPHITLARIKTDQWRRMENPPAIEENFEAQVSVGSIEVMESNLKHDGAEYAVLESCALGSD
jgi:2'-5' RNA ligase